MNKGLIGALIALGLLLVGGAIYFLGFDRTEETARVVESSWERTMQEQLLKPKEYSGWELPAGATILEREDRFHHYDMVLFDEPKYITAAIPAGVKAEDVPLPPPASDTFPSLNEVPKDRKESGNFKTYKVLEVYVNDKGEREWKVQKYEPKAVKQPWYRYQVNEWQTGETLRAAAKNAEPYWPDFGPTTDTRKPGTTTENYVAIFETKSGTRYTKTFSKESEWAAFVVGKEVTLAINRVGGFVVR